jgi:wyosine [tRNA(Phe)-imidazoG37] synthetase (radical SAM superfamily)
LKKGRNKSLCIRNITTRKCNIANCIYCNAGGKTAVGKERNEDWAGVQERMGGIKEEMDDGGKGRGLNRYREKQER